MKTRSAALEGIRKVGLIERDIEPAPDQILVKAHSASICLADIQMYRQGYYFYAKRHEKPNFPMFIGHESGGTVVSVGSRVHEYKEGDKVILMHSPRTSGTVTPGGMSDYWVAHPLDVVPVPEGMDMDLASLAETVCPFIFVVFRSGIKLGDTVAVTGANFIGQIIAQGLKKSGALSVTVIDNRDFRLEMAKKLGADNVINSAKVNAYEAAMELTKGRGFDLVAQTAAYIDPTVEEYMNLATEIVRPMGILVFQGDFLHPITIHNFQRWHHESLDIRSVAFRHYTPQEIQVWAPDCLKVMQHELIQIRPLITATFPLEKVADAFRLADEDPDQLKVVLKP
ncbi:MAG TPA: zinc-binding dehydrogenase [Dehalococcoidia bacterium]|jgi:L-iditol 2-dehydrogenase|nr:zinc-binding dehydrogenase [Dehalococcoidia bacterium]